MLSLYTLLYVNTLSRVPPPDAKISISSLSVERFDRQRHFQQQHRGNDFYHPGERGEGGSSGEKLPQNEPIALPIRSTDKEFISPACLHRDSKRTWCCTRAVQKRTSRGETFAIIESQTCSSVLEESIGDRSSSLEYTASFQSMERRARRFRF